MSEISAVSFVCLVAAASAKGKSHGELYEHVVIKRDDINNGVFALIRDYYPEFLERENETKQETIVVSEENHYDSGSDPLYAFFITCGIPLIFIAIICLLYVLCKCIRICTTNSVGDQVDSLLSDQCASRENCYAGRWISGCVAYRTNPQLQAGDDLESARLMDGTNFSIHIVNSKEWDLPPSYEEVMLSAVSCAAPAYEECFRKC